ncbi:MAG: hypothetical protein EA361_06525 [Bacteroidetes bacterium]|nr:MAG: hypothetical protein EA361_06525 [Bacteroidota bacterium]
MAITDLSLLFEDLAAHTPDYSAKLPSKDGKKTRQWILNANLFLIVKDDKQNSNALAVIFNNNNTQSSTKHFCFIRITKIKTTIAKQQFQIL